MAILAQYILSRVAFGWLIILSIACILVISIDSVMQLEVSGSAGVSTLVAFALALLHLPIMVESALPFVFLFGTMIAFQLLNRRSELVVFRASGISGWYFVLVPTIAAAFVGLAVAFLVNPLSAQLNGIYETRKNELENKQGESLALTENGLWMRRLTPDQEIILHARGVDEEQLVMNQVVIWQHKTGEGQDFLLERRLDAQRAQIKSLRGPGNEKNSDFLQLWQVWETRLDEPSVFMESLALPTTIDGQLFFSRYANPDNLSIYRLLSAIDVAQQSGFNAGPFQVKLWSLLALPLLFAAMTMISAVLSISFKRNRQYVRLGLTAAIIGILMFFANSLLFDFAESGLLPAILAVIAAPLCVIFLSISILVWTEDG